MEKWGNEIFNTPALQALQYSNHGCETEIEDAQDRNTHLPCTKSCSV